VFPALVALELQFEQLRFGPDIVKCATTRQKFGRKETEMWLAQLLMVGKKENDCFWVMKINEIVYSHIRNVSGFKLSHQIYWKRAWKSIEK